MDNGDGTAGGRNEVSGDPGAVIQAGTVHGVVINAPATGPATPPRQLPPAIRGFINRENDLAALDALLPDLTATPDARSGAVVISAIAGLPGVGKTALAIHWAHTVRHRFPDGELYIDMRGYGPGLPLDTDQALDTLLRGLEVAADRIPTDPDARAALYRSLLSGKHFLVMIDNASDARTVRPLLPGTATCLALVTSRHALTGLVAREGARRILLDVLTPDESLTLLKEVIGSRRILAEPQAARILGELCGHLPIALRVIAARILGDPFLTLADLVEELVDEGGRLDALGGDDEASDVRAAFASSYRILAPDAAELFRRLALHPGADISAPAAAALAGRDAGVTRRLLRTLVDAQLLQPSSAGRYRLHDLLRAFAREHAEADDPPQVRTRAVRRLLSWYVLSADAADRTIAPNFHPIPLDGLDREVEPMRFDGMPSASAWFEAERANMLDALRAAAVAGHHDIAWRLPIVSYGFFELRSYRSDWREIHGIGIASARAIGDRFGEASNELGLADACISSAEQPEALRHYQRSADLAREIGDAWIEGFSLFGMGDTYRELGRIADAVTFIEDSVQVFRAQGERRGEGMALRALGACHRAEGAFDDAVACCRQAVTIFTELDDTWTVAWGELAIGDAFSAGGRHDDALASYQRALATFQAFDDKRSQSRALIGLATSLDASGHRTEGRDTWRRAADLLDTLGDPEAAAIRQRLNADQGPSQEA